MFRYIGISWAPSAPGQAALAERVTRKVSAAREWQSALRLPGLHVYVTGHEPDVNGIHPLPSNRGVVLGRLFRRHASTFRASQPFSFSPQESDDIVRTSARSLVENFWGRYVAFIPSWNGPGQVLRDPMGTLPCFQVDLDGVGIVFSWLEDWLELGEGPQPTVSWDAVASQLLIGECSGRETALTGVSQVLPGELVPMGQQRATPIPLWNAADVARQQIDTDPAAAAERLYNAVAMCAQSWGAVYQHILLRLSGGLDSAILLSALCRTTPPEQVTCINYYSGGAASDERSYARLAAQRAGTTLVEQERDSAFRLDAVLDVARTPTPGNYLGRMGTGRSDSRAAQACGAKAMFTGSGGDQLFYELRCTWPAADHLKRHGLGRGFLGAALDAAHLGRVSFWEAARRAIADQSFRGDPLSGVGRYVTLASRDAIDRGRLHARRFVHPWLWSATDLPIGKYHHVADLITPPEYFDPYLREQSPEVVAPLRSQPLVELCLALPTYTLTRGGRGRALARQAFSADIPTEIAHRQSKGSIEEHITDVLQRSLPLARSLLLEGRLAGQGLLDRKRLEAALSGSPSATDTYASEIHSCIAIEAWLQRLATARSGRACRT